MTLELATLVKADLVQRVSEWLAADPIRSQITWASDPNRPLRWAVKPGHPWTPTALRDEIFKGAGLAAPTSSAADAWSYNDQSLYTIANSSVEGA